ncbi:pantothenate synthetase [Thalassococcus halodurans]|uniref:Pantothenate synthetase n=1 Tax=Thalassococcus halodurans TaxID=373675 RepID=A0A1H5TZ68_9RHOB|nr:MULTISPECIES: pantoate--beta-alanine ligase [Thalassococcus]MBO6866082.1 pantoate--beta-alanine ligase [Thalassococcus sp.]SEF68030.1 pantothenate synthetase [Thalassococcus halodurans]
MTAPIIRSLPALRAAVSEWKSKGECVAVVPTMGALHAGHLSLVEAAKAGADRVIVTIFVNPKQFNSAEDLANYPRTEEDDAVKLAPFGVDAIYVPDGATMYPEGFATTVSVEGLTDVLCGAHRPGHFDGVATVVSKLFLQTGADKAFFGEKDFQQLQVVKRMATDLDIPIDITGCPTIRDDDGLALSSRNARLTKDGRAAAPVLYAQMQKLADEVNAGRALKPALEEATANILAAGFTEVEYLDLRAKLNLRLMERLDEPARLFAAAWIDGVRLIDNIAV